MESASGEPWMMRIEGVLSAQFKQPDGSSRPGSDWKVGLKRGEALRTILVRAYLAPDATAATRKDTDYQGQTVMDYVNELLQRGWQPTESVPDEIIIKNPAVRSAGSRSAAGKPWWRFW